MTLRGWTEQELRLNCCETNPAFQLQDPCDKEPKSIIVSIGKYSVKNQRNKSVKQNEEKFIPITNTRFNIKLLKIYEICISG